MTKQNKIQEDFLPLTIGYMDRLEEADLSKAEFKLWLYLTKKEIWGNRYVDLPDTLSVLEKVGISKSTYYKALAKFQEFEFFDIQDRGMSVRHLAAAKVRKNKPLSEKSNCQSEISDYDSEKKDCKNDFSDSQPLKPAPVKDSESPKIHNINKINKTLSDPYGDESPLTVESTEVVGSQETEEREKKKLTEEEEEEISVEAQERSHPYSELANKKVVESLAGNENPNPKTEFARNSENETASKEESQPSKATSQPQQSESSTTEPGQKLSSSPENAVNSRPKPKSSSSRGKGFGGRSINEILNPHTRIPRTRRELREFYSFGKEDCDEFEKFAESKAKKYREEVVILDSWVLSMLESMVAEYRVWKQKKDYAQRVRASYVAQEQKTESEPEQIEESDPQKPQRSMKEIAAEIRRKRDEELAKKQQNKGKK